VFFLKEKTSRFKLFYLLLLFINLAALFITKSRGSYIGFAAGAIFVIWFNYRSIKKFAAVLGTMVLISLPMIYVTGIYKRILQLFDFNSGTGIIRLAIWDRAWYLFSQSPLLGIGFGRFNDIYSIDRSIFDIDRLKGVNGVIAYYANQSFNFDTAHAHNSYLQFLTETGVLGLGLLILFWVLCLVKLLQAYYKTKDEFASKTFLSAAGSIFVVFILALSENYFSVTTLMIPLSIIVSISIGMAWQEIGNNFKHTLR
jgi:O-antigen ligase